MDHLKEDKVEVGMDNMTIMVVPPMKEEGATEQEEVLLLSMGVPQEDVIKIHTNNKGSSRHSNIHLTWGDHKHKAALMLLINKETGLLNLKRRIQANMLL